MSVEAWMDDVGRGWRNRSSRRRPKFTSKILATCDAFFAAASVRFLGEPRPDRSVERRCLPGSDMECV